MELKEPKKEYDENGNLIYSYSISRSLLGDVSAVFEENNEYDENGKLIRQRKETTDNIKNVDISYTENEYNEKGKIVSTSQTFEKHNSKGELLSTRETKTTNEYDDSGKLISTYSTGNGNSYYFDGTVKRTETDEQIVHGVDSYGSKFTTRVKNTKTYNNDELVSTTEEKDNKTSNYNETIKTVVNSDGSERTETFIDDHRTKSDYTDKTIEIITADGTKKTTNIYEKAWADEKKGSYEIIYPDGSSAKRNVIYSGGKIYMEPSDSSIPLSGDEISMMREVVYDARYKDTPELPSYKDADRIAQIISNGKYSKMTSMVGDYDFVMQDEERHGKDVLDIISASNWETVADNMLEDARLIEENLGDFLNEFEGFGGEVGEELEKCLELSYEDAKDLGKFIQNKVKPAAQVVERIKELLKESQIWINGGVIFGGRTEGKNALLAKKDELLKEKAKYGNNVPPTKIVIDSVTGVETVVPNSDYAAYKTIVDEISEVERKLSTIESCLFDLRYQLRCLYDDLKIYNDAVVKFTSQPKWQAYLKEKNGY